ncbi:MAG: alpha/beta hydrolase [Galactobacter sp.]
MESTQLSAPAGVEPTGTGVLVIHGFTSTPGSVRPWAQACNEAGHSVSTPLLPGHGTRWEDLIETPAEAWLEAVEDAYDALASTVDRVAVCGLSMGGALALHLAAVRRPVAVYLVNPALTPHPFAMRLTPALKYMRRSVAGIGGDVARPGSAEPTYERTPLAAVAQLGRLQRQVRGELPGIAAPVTLFRSDVDHVVSDASVAAVRSGLRADVEYTQIPLHESFHVATLDYDADLIACHTLTDLERFTPSGPAAGTGRHRGKEGA